MSPGACLDSFGLSSPSLLDARRLTPDLLHTPSSSHGLLYNRSASLLMDRVHDTHITPDTSPVNMLSSPMDYRLSRLSEEQLLANGSTPYVQAQVIIERQRQKISEMENKIRGLEIDLIAWKIRSTSTQDTLDKLIQSGVSSTGIARTTLSAHKNIPPPLDRKDYHQVRFWTSNAFHTYRSNLAGETNGLATRKKRRGRRRNSESHELEDVHPYMEYKDGSVVPGEIIAKVGQRAQRLWQALVNVGLAPDSWGNASEDAYRYFNGEILNDPEFDFLRYCDGNWKLMRWATKAYSSWKRNHIKRSDVGKTDAPRGTKRKLADLDDPLLLPIEDKDEDIAVTASHDFSPIENNSDALASPVPSGSISSSIQQPAMLIDPLDELYDEVDRNTTSGAANPSTIPGGNPGPLTYTIATIAASAPVTIPSASSAPTTSVSSVSLTTTLATLTPSMPMTTASSEKDIHEAQDTGPRSVDDNTMGITGETQTLAASSSSVSTPPLATTNDNEPTGQRQSSVKRVKGLAVVGKGLTEKNFCMKDWLERNPNGLKDAFEQHFKALPEEARKASDLSLSARLDLKPFCMQTYKDRANAALKAARMDKKKGLQT